MAKLWTKEIQVYSNKEKWGWEKFYIFRKFLCYHKRKWGPTACHSKANKEASLVERKVCFILEASNHGGVWTPVQKPTPHPLCWQSVGKCFIGWRRGIHAETVRSALTVIVKSVIADLTSVIWSFYVQLIFSSLVSLFPSPWGQFHN